MKCRIASRLLLVLAVLIPAHAAIASESLAPGDIAVLSLPASTATTFTIITNRGYVSYEVDGKWVVLSAHSRMPVAAMAFQMMDPADQGTPDSTNLMVGLYETGSSSAEEALARLGSEPGGSPSVTATRGPWTIETQEATQGVTVYTVIDAIAPIADVRVGIRLTWPRLSAHSPGHDKEMRSRFFRLLDSVEGGIGLYERHDGEVVRRPE